MRRQPFRLAWPPTDNHYYTVAGKRKILSEAGRQYKLDAAWEMQAQSVPKVTEGEVKYSVHVYCHPPDLRRRDLGNLQKALMDSLGEYGAITDDGDVDKLTFERCEVCRPFGFVEVIIEEMEDVNARHRRA